MWAVEVAGNRLLSASADKTIRMWDITSRRCEQVLEDHARPVLSLAVCGNKLFSGSYDYTIKVWSLDTLQRLKTLTGESGFMGESSTALQCSGAAGWKLYLDGGGETLVLV